MIKVMNARLRPRWRSCHSHQSAMPSNVLSKDASLMRCWPIGIEGHLPIIEQEMLCDATPKIAVPVRSNSYNPRFGTAMAPIFTLLVEKVDSVLWQLFRLERECDLWQWFELRVEPFAEFGQTAPPMG